MMISETQLILCGVAVSGLLIAAAMRGGRMHATRWCARCRYNLTGVAVDSLRCPECGSLLAPFEAVRAGRRSPYPRLLAAGVAVLAITALVVGVRTVQWLDRVDWQAQKPAMWLAFQAASAKPSTAGAALDELTERAEAGELSDERLRSLAASGLELQSDGDTAWEPRWGALIEVAARRGLLTPQQRESYLRHSITFSMALQNRRTSQMYLPPGKAEQIRKARLTTLDPLAVTKFDFADVEFVVTAQRPGRESRLTIDMRPLSASIGSWQCLDLPDSEQRSMLFHFRSMQSSSARSTRVLWLPIVVEPGEHRVKMQWEVCTRFEDDPPETALIATMNFERSLIVEPPAEDALAIATDAAATEVLKDAFSVHAIGFRQYKPRRGEQVMRMIYLHFDTGPHQRLHPGEPLAPFNGSIDLRVSSGGAVLHRTGSYLPGAWVPVVVESDEISTVDLQVRYSKTGTSAGVGEGPGFGGEKQQPYWMGPPFEVTHIPVTWFDTIEQANLSEDELETIRFMEPR